MSLLVLDVGSSSVRALLLDDHARLLPGALVSRPHRFDSDASTSLDHLRQLIEGCLDDLLTHPQVQAIEAVGMAVFVGNLVGLDAQQQPCTPLYTYADTRSAPYVSALRPVWDSTYPRTGCPPHSAYHPAKLCWLQAQQPALYAQVHTWTDLATYLYQQWFGKSPCSYSVASWSGLLNRHTLTWDAEWLSVLGLGAEQFPALADYPTRQQGLTDSYRQRWPALADVPFYLAVGDGAAANVGSGAVESKQAALTIGTTAALRRIVPQVGDDPLPAIPQGLWAYRVGRRQHLIGGATNEGGNIYQWVCQTLALGDLAKAEATLASRPPGAHGLTFLPLLAGERSPGWQAEARGSLTGISLATTPLDILQAALEGVALRLRLLLAQLTQLGPVEQIYAGGGALMGSPAWAGMLCHALQQPLALLDEPEVTARGVAILLLQDLKGESWSAPPPTVGRILQPDLRQAEQWATLQAAQVALYHELLGK